jgi:predicted RNase H-like HicB family nuclease
LILDLFIKKTDDGFTGEVPSLKGCETWAPDEDEAVEKSIELARYYLKLTARQPLKVDKTRDDFVNKTYKLIFEK